DRSADDARRRDARIARFERCLHGVELRTFDDRRHLDGNVLGDGLLPTGLRFRAVEHPLPHVDRVGQDLVQRADAKARVPPGAVAPLVEALDDLLHTDRAGLAVAVQIEAEDHLYGLGLDRIDHETLLDASAALFDLLRPVAERDGSTVPK